MDDVIGDPMSRFGGSKFCWIRVQQSSSKFRILPLQVKDQTWANCVVALSVSGPRVHSSGPAFMPRCICSEVRLPPDQRVLCSDCCKKCRLLCLAQVVLSYFVVCSSKIPLVLTTKVTHLRSLLFRQPDGVHCVVRRVYLAVIAKLSLNRVVQLVDYGW